MVKTTTVSCHKCAKTGFCAKSVQFISENCTPQKPCATGVFSKVCNCAIFFNS